MSHLMTCGEAPNCTWTNLAIPTLAGVNCANCTVLENIVTYTCSCVVSGVCVISVLYILFQLHLVFSYSRS